MAIEHEDSRRYGGEQDSICPETERDERRVIESCQRGRKDPETGIDYRILLNVGTSVELSALLP